MREKFYFLGIFLFCFFCFSFLYSEGILDLVPSSSRVIGIIDMKKVKEKSGNVNITNMPLFQKWISDMDLEDAKNNIGTIFGSPEKIGIDTLGKAVFFAGMNDLEEEMDYSCIIFPLSDGQKFDSWIRSRNVETNLEIQSKNGYFTMGDSEFSLTWTKDKVVILNSKVLDTESDMQNQIKEIMTLGSNDSITKIADFSQILSEEWDSLFWVNLSFISNSITGGNDGFKNISKNAGRLEALDIKMNFENDLVKLDTDIFYDNKNSELDKTWIKSLDQRIPDMLPVSHLLAALLFSLDIEKSLSMLSKEDKKTLKEYFSTENFYYFWDLLPALKGDFLFSLSELDLKKESFNLFGAATILDRKQLDNWLSKMQRSKVLVKEKTNSKDTVYKISFAPEGGKNKNTKQAKPQAGTPEFYLIVRDDLFYLANPDKKTRLLKNISETGLVSEELKNFVRTNSMSFYLDCQEMINQAVTDPSSGDEFSMALLYFKDKLKDLKVYSSFPAGNRVSLHADIDLMTKQRNSLLSVIEWVNGFAPGPGRDDKKPDPGEKEN